MLSTAFAWVSRISRLTLITRTTYEGLISAKENFENVVRIYLEARENISELMGLIEDLRAALTEAQEKIALANAKAETANVNAAVAVDRLEMIAAAETPTANATVKRMARIAREGIEEVTG